MNHNIFRQRIIGVIFLLLIVIPFMSAQVNPTITSEPYFTQGEQTTIPLPCTINGDYCSINATCKTTIINPNNVILFNDYNMSRNGAVFEVTLTANQTEVLGEYQFNVVCSDAGQSVSRFLKFHINQTGIANNSTETMFFIFIGLILFVLIIVSLWQMSKSEDYAWALGYLSFAYLLIIILLFIVYQISVYYISSITIVITFTYFLWWFSLIMFFPYLIIAGLYLLSKVVEEKEMKKYVDMGYTSKEATHMRKRR